MADLPTVKLSQVARAIPPLNGLGSVPFLDGPTMKRALISDILGSQWAPVFAAETDGARVILKITDWTGGASTEKPGIGYLGLTGLVTNKADAIDIFSGVETTLDAYVTTAQIAAAEAQSAANQIDVIPGPSQTVWINANGNTRLIIDAQGLHNTFLDAVQQTANQALVDIETAGIDTIPGPSSTVLINANGNARMIIDASGAHSTYLDQVAADAQAGALSALPRPRIKIASDHGGWNAHSVVKSNPGTQGTSATYRLAFKVNTNVIRPRFIYVGGVGRFDGAS